MSDVQQLAQFLDLWFGPQEPDIDDAALSVGRLLRFNRPVDGSLEGEVEVLVVEQQGVWLWGRAPDGRYVERENEPGVPWRDIGETTVEFWLHHAAFEAATNLPASRSAQMFDAATVARLKRKLVPLPCRAWAWPGSRQSMHYRGASIVMICEDGEDYWVIASAPSETDLTWLDELNLTWDESNTRQAVDG